MQVFWDHLAATFNRPLASRSSLLPNSLHEEGYLFQSCSVNDIHDFVKILCQMIFTVSYCNKYRLVSPPHVFIESFNPRVSRRTIKMFALLPNPSLTVPPTRSAKRTSTESDQGPKASRVFEVHN